MADGAAFGLHSRTPLVGPGMKTQRPQRQSGDRAKPADPTGKTREQLMARIELLESELARFKSTDGARPATEPGHLTTVKVPAQFEAPFLRAQEYVTRYFVYRIEQPDT